MTNEERRIKNRSTLGRTHSVTSRISIISQPYGGYINPKNMKVTVFEDGNLLSTENISPILAGLVVDYLSRFMTGSSVEDSFYISLIGYKARLYLLGSSVQIQDKNTGIDAQTLLSRIKGLDDASIIAACKIVTYDVWYRNAAAAVQSAKPYEVYPDQQTIHNIRIMVERSVQFFKTYGPVIHDGFTFEHGGYTDTVSTGDGDFLTKDTLWDFKVSKYPPTSKHTLQLLMYYIMGRHSGQSCFSDINKIGIFNPRLNSVYLYNIADISKEYIKEIETDVIGY